MHKFMCSLLTTILVVLSDHSIAVNIPEQSLLSTTPAIRNATLADAEAVTKIILAAFHDSPEWKYAYQFMDDYPEEHYNCMYELARDALSYPSTDVLAQLVLLPNNTEPHELTPVAVALWVLPTAWDSRVREHGRALSMSLLNTLMLSKCEHRDVNITRGEDYSRQMDVIDEYLDDRYPVKQQLYLNTLGTHPGYQRQGAGSLLVRSGVEFGRDTYNDRDVTATLIATEAGEPLYMHLGWNSIRNFTIQSLDVVDGKREEFRYDVMDYEL